MADATGEMKDYVRDVEEEATDYGTRGRYDPPKLWFPLFLLRVAVCFL